MPLQNIQKYMYFLSANMKKTQNFLFAKNFKESSRRMFFELPLT